MRFLILLACLATALGCTHKQPAPVFHLAPTSRPAPELVKMRTVHPGMTMDEVRALLGPPAEIDTWDSGFSLRFTSPRWVYYPTVPVGVAERYRPYMFFVAF